MRRVVRPEMLDGLPAASPEAIRARADLRRLNRLLGHAGALARILEPYLEITVSRRRPLRIYELGAGDGRLLLALARIWSARGVAADAVLVDLHHLLTGETRRAFAGLGWKAETVAMDVRLWLARPELVEADLILANLFLHHFPDDALRVMFRQIAGKTACFAACEPRRTDAALAASRWLRGLGCGYVTRHDAPLSIRAGFEGGELGALWPDREGWVIAEGPAGWFSHGFVAKRI